jgi:hypothetical protein
LLGAFLLVLGERKLELFLHQPREVDLVWRNGSRHRLLDSLN